MKKNKILTVWAMLLVVLLLCTGCRPDLGKFDNEQIRTYAESMLDALIEDDVQAGYGLVSKVCTEAEFTPIFDQMQAMIGSVDTYSLELLSIQKSTNITNGQRTSVTSVSYQMVTGADKIIVSLQVDDDAGLISFYLTPYDKTDYFVTGTLGNMDSAGAWQWILLLSNLLVAGVTVFAIVDCCRQKIKKKAGWILLIILGFMAVGVTVSATGFRLNFNFGWILSYSALVRYGSGTFVLRLLMPVGAIGYFAARRSLLSQAASVPVPVEEGAEKTVEESDPEQ